MLWYMIENVEALLQEGIAFTDKEVAYLKAQQTQAAKAVPLILGICTLAVMTFMAYCIMDSFSRLSYSDFILFALAGMALYGFCYLVFWLLRKYDNANLERDIKQGKSILTSIVIGRDKTEYGTYLTFAGPDNNNRIRITVTPSAYNNHQVGTKVMVTYLKFSKRALEIVEV